MCQLLKEQPALIFLYPLLQVVSLVQQDKALAWFYAAIGFMLLAGGLRALGGGIAPADVVAQAAAR